MLVPVVGLATHAAVEAGTVEARRRNSTTGSVTKKAAVSFATTATTTGIFVWVGSWLLGPVGIPIAAVYCSLAMRGAKQKN